MSNILKGFLFALLVTLSFVAAPRAQEESETAGESERLKIAVEAPNTCDYYRWVNSQPEEVRRSAPFARSVYDAMKVLGPNGDMFDPEVRLNAFHQSQEDLRKSSIHYYKAAGGGSTPLANSWNLIGPLGAGVFTSGCITTIAIDPVDTKTLYAGAAGGGVWKSIDAGANWTSLTDEVIPDQNVCSIAIDPSNPSVIYVGSGSADQGAGNFDWTGYGVFKSIDGGATWTNSHPGGGAQQTVPALIVHPTKGNIVLAGLYSGARGLYRSTDAGTTWKKVQSAGGVIWDIVVGATTGGVTTFYALEGNGGNENGVYKSTDDGATWVKSSTGITSATSFHRGKLGCPAANQSLVYACATDGNNGYLFKSTDAGASWASQQVPPTVFNVKQPQGDYDMSFAVSPASNTSDTLYILGVEAWASYGSSGWTAWSSYDLSNFNQHPHVDHHSIAIDPKNPKIVYNGNDGGLYKSVNNGLDWGYSSNGMTTTRIYHLALDKNSFKTVWYGAQDQGTWNMQKGGAATFNFGGDGFQPVVNPQNSNIVYITLPYGEIYKKNGPNWVLSDTIHGGSWDSPLKMSPQNSGVLFKGDGGGLVRKTTDGGTVWKQMSTGISGSLTAIGVSAADPNIVWAAGGSNIKVSTNGGSAWTARSSGMPAGLIMNIVTHWSNPGFALVPDYSTNAAQVMLTTNMGQTWTNVAGTGTNKIPSVGVSCVAIDSTSPMTKWYAATDNGMYYTTNAGQDWWIAGSGIGLVVCTDVQLSSNKVTLRVATYGRGVWEAQSTDLVPGSHQGAVGSLVASRDTKGTILTWHSASSGSVAGFYVERSISGNAFEDLGYVAAAGAGTEQHYTFLDQTTMPGTYLFRIREVDQDGTVSYSELAEIHYGGTGVILDQNFPNPFVLGAEGVTPSTRIRFELPASDIVSLAIFDLSGQEVKSLISESRLDGGQHTINWDGRTNTGAMVTSGSYFYVLQTKSGQRLVNKISVVE